MRSPTLADDGWQLEDGEIRHREAPRTFDIPDQEARWNSQRGDMAKLLFSIDAQSSGKPIVERMWVVVTTRVEDLYLGILVNAPRSPGATDRLSLGAEFCIASLGNEVIFEFVVFCKSLFDQIKTRTL